MANKVLTINGFKVWEFMAIIDHATDLQRRFFAPVWPSLEASPKQRQCQDYSDRVPGRSNFFEALKSQRRLSMVKDVAERLRRHCAGTLPDVLAQFSQLDGFDVYAGDGPRHRHATHDEAIDGTKLPITHLYTRNLRDGWMTHLSLCPVKEKGNHHDMAVLKSLAPTLLTKSQTPILCRSRPEHFPEPADLLKSDPATK